MASLVTREGGLRETECLKCSFQPSAAREGLGILQWRVAGQCVSHWMMCVMVAPSLALPSLTLL